MRRFLSLMLVIALTLALSTAALGETQLRVWTFLDPNRRPTDAANRWRS